MNRKHDSACVESDSCPAKEREKVVLFWKHNLPRNYVNFFTFWGVFCFVLLFVIIKCYLTKKQKNCYILCMQAITHGFYQGKLT